jgi:hypothetical protein
MTLVLSALQFALELAALAAFAAWGAQAAVGPAGWLLAAAAVLAAATAWGLWAAPNSRRRLADPARLAFEAAFFAAAGLALARTGRPALGVALAVTAVANTGLLRVLLRQASPR